MASPDYLLVFVSLHPILGEIISQSFLYPHWMTTSNWIIFSQSPLGICCFSFPDMHRFTLNYRPFIGASSIVGRFKRPRAPCNSHLLLLRANPNLRLFSVTSTTKCQSTFPEHLNSSLISFTPFRWNPFRNRNRCTFGQGGGLRFASPVHPPWTQCIGTSILFVFVYFN